MFSGGCPGFFVIVFLGACFAFLSNQYDYIFDTATALQTTLERVGLKVEEFYIPSGTERQHILLVDTLFRYAILFPQFVLARSIEA